MAFRRRQRYHKIESFDYKDVDTLRKFINERGKIVSRRVTGLSAKQQRMVTRCSPSAPVIWRCCRLRDRGRVLNTDNGLPYGEWIFWEIQTENFSTIARNEMEGGSQERT